MGSFCQQPEVNTKIGKNFQIEVLWLWTLQLAVKVMGLQQLAMTNSPQDNSMWDKSYTSIKKIVE